MSNFTLSIVLCLGYLCILPNLKAEDYIDANEDSFKDMGLENWNKARIYHFFSFLNTNPCNAMYVTLGIADAQCTLRCLAVGSQLGGYCSNGECQCNMFTNMG